MFCLGDNLQQILPMITTELNKLQIWFDRNKLSINLSKAKLMLFGRYKPDCDIKLIIDNINGKG